MVDHVSEVAQLTEDLLEALADGVVAIDSQYRIISFSLAAERITGYTRDEVIGRPCQEVFRSDRGDCPSLRSLIWVINGEVRS